MLLWKFEYFFIYLSCGDPSLIVHKAVALTAFPQIRPLPWALDIEIMGCPCGKVTLSIIQSKASQ